MQPPQSSNQFSVRSLIPRVTQIAFIVGLLLGILLGWLFSGVVGAVMRFGIVAVLLVLFAGAAWFWWNTRKASKGEGPTVVTWTSGSIPQRPEDLFRGQGVPQQPRREEPAEPRYDVIDVELEKLKQERDS